ncbi:hypothetical protein HX776_22900 [Pseudomonas agarici]|uniref:hypothetical protein n=1 Tax=Pseudomonas agarici TaxID=46677 RepID=UPI000311B1CF|nr:hypothetical protein [Pseudomonas agarici]NWC11642.1 hypothetical protein [Pseudomonas agarici]SEL79954.1 hypothetical protein SAMN05216604_13445 [Pseudomonas agarici]
MNTPSSAPAFSRQIRQADETAGQWLTGLLDGKGNTPSHAIVTAVLGCVPVVGQLFDLRDLIRCIITLTTSPNSIGSWVELLVTLIGCIPGFGDAFKAAFKLARSGQNVNRVFDAMRTYARINPRAALQSLDWSKIQREALQMLNSMLDNLISALDGWLVKLVAGRQQAHELIKTLSNLKQQAPSMLQKATGELKKTVDDLLQQPNVLSTAQVSGAQRSLPTPPMATRPSSTTTTASSKVQHSPIVDNTGKNPANRGQTPTVHQIRQSKRKRWASGVPAEHIVEYYVKSARPSCRKINDHGRLTEEWESSKKKGNTPHRQSAVTSQGLDHLWFGQHKGRPYTVGETKGSTWAQFSFLAAMSEGDRKVVEGTRADTAKVLGDQQAYNPELAMSKDAPSSTYVTIDNEKALADVDKQTGTLSSTKTKGRQMSHWWIELSIQQDYTIPASHKIKIIDALQLAVARQGNLPYNREIFMVTGKQYETHERSKGKTHKPQLPIINIPDEILGR